jgi:hypothetical protein
MVCGGCQVRLLYAWFYLLGWKTLFVVVVKFAYFMLGFICLAGRLVCGGCEVRLLYAWF